MWQRGEGAGVVEKLQLVFEDTRFFAQVIDHIKEVPIPDIATAAVISERA